MRAAVGKGRVAIQGPVEFTASAELSCQTQTFRNCGDEASCLFTPAVGEPGDEGRTSERAGLDAVQKTRTKGEGPENEDN